MWDFIVKLLKLKDPITGQKYNSIFIIIDKFTKWEYFITYIKEILVKDIVQVYVKEVFLFSKLVYYYKYAVILLFSNRIF